MDRRIVIVRMTITVVLVPAFILLLWRLFSLEDIKARLFRARTLAILEQIAIALDPLCQCE